MLTVHHLNFSRGTRILWLLEELNHPYELVRYPRDENFRAPPALAAIHPMGKAPVIQDGDFILGESAVILDYINTRYGNGRFAPPFGSNDYFKHNALLHYVESTGFQPILMMRIGTITGGMSDAMRTYLTPLLARVFNHMTLGIDGRYMMGDELTLADIQMVYLLAVAEGTGLLADQPQLTAYLARLHERPALQKAIEIGGPMMPPRR